MKHLLPLLLLALCLVPAGAQHYYVYVAAESEDEVNLVRFDAATEVAAVVKDIPVGSWPQEIEGPHGLRVSPDGQHWYLSLAHGNPYGRLLKYETGTDELVGQVELGLFPATMDISEATGLVYVVNFNLHGDMEPSSVSVVEPMTMTEIERIEQGIMPHGSRVGPSGQRHYSVSMMTGELFEIDADGLTVHRRLHTGHGAMPDETHADASMNHGGMHGADDMAMDMKTKPTWVHPHPDGRHAYVANNGLDEVVEIDLEKWAVTRRFSTGKAPYNLEVSADGTWLVVSYKGAAQTGVWNLATGEEVARIDNTRRVSHGVTISPDSRYAFVSVEGIGGEPGSVDVIDLQKLARVAHAETGKQAGGISFWKMVE